MSGRKRIGDADLKVRIPSDLKWRIDYFASLQHQTTSAAIRMLLVKALGSMDAAETREYKMHLKGLQESEDRQTEAASREPTIGVPPDMCGQCGESEVPIVGGNIWMVNSVSKKATCNNCGYKIEL